MPRDPASLYFFDHRELCFSFVVDCSVNEAGECVVYEVQSTASENWKNALDPEGTKASYLTQRFLFTDFFRNHHQNHFLINLLSVIDGKKHFQRALLESNADTKPFNPSYLIFKKSQLNDALIVIRNIFQSQKIVIKSDGACGLGNLFFDLATVSDYEMQKALIQRSYFLEEGSTIFTAEAQKMYAPFQEDCERFLEHQNLGVYYRYLVFYYPKDQRVEFYPVYRNILDIAHSTNSHSLNKKINLEEVAYFLSETPEQLIKYLSDQKNKYPVFYKRLADNFQKISKVFFEFTLKNQAKYCFSKKFMDDFHKSSSFLYYKFFAIEAVRYVASFPESLAIYNHYHLFRLFLKQLLNTVSDGQDKNNFYLALARQKMNFLLVLKAGLLSGTTLTSPELFLLQEMLSFAKKSVRAPLREIWRQHDFWGSYKEPIYGETRTGTDALALLKTAVKPCQTDPIVMDDAIFCNL